MKGERRRMGECRLSTSNAPRTQRSRYLLTVYDRRLTSIVDTPEEAAALERAAAAHSPPARGVPRRARARRAASCEAEPVGDGHSNVTYLIRRDGGDWVLRRPPRPPLPPSAHDVLREAFLLRARRGHRRARRRRCSPPATTSRVIGAPFYVMERVEGVVLNAELPARARCEPARIGDELIDALVEVHAVDWQACGLEGFGKPTGYLERQVRRFTGLWEHNAHARDAGARRGHRVARRAPPRVRPGHDRARRLPARQRDVHAGDAR